VTLSRRARVENETAAVLKSLRQDLEVGAAINIIEGINTIETLAALGHWMQKRRAPTPREAKELGRKARLRWATQVRHVLSVMRADGTDLDEKMADLADILAASPTPSVSPAGRQSRSTKRTKRRSR
jgi:hypothetical protein